MKDSVYKDMKHDEFGLAAAIDQIGEELVSCKDGCAGVLQNQFVGVLPRCLIVERRESSGRGCLAAGLNPGRSPEKERGFHVEHGCMYESVKAYCHSQASRIQYYAKAKRAIDGLGLDGPILWSALAKCENAVDEGGPPLQTLRHCAGPSVAKSQ